MGVFIIAEAGVNHNGSKDTALQMVDSAKDSGADCIKFQTFMSKSIVSRNTGKADYQKEHTAEDETQFEMLKKLELPFDDFRGINAYCRERGIEFLSTPFDFESVDFLSSIDMKRWKIPSGEITNLPYLVRIAHLGKPVLLSTGMSTMNEVRAAVSVLRENGSGEITLLHCTTEYPTPYKDVNLRAMRAIADEFGLPVGYSDHTEGIEVSIAAVAMGAVVVEKHFTLSKDMEGPDHKASLKPRELNAMVNAIRHIEDAFGSGHKGPTEIEKKNMAAVRKSIVAKKHIKRGECLTADNMTVKRPGTGINPMRWHEVIGREAPRDFEEDELIEI